MSTSPLPIEPGTSRQDLDKAVRSLQRRLNEYGGQLITEGADGDKNVNLLAQHMKANGTDPSKNAYKVQQIVDALWAGVCACFSQLAFQPVPQKLLANLQYAKAQKLEARDLARRVQAEKDNQPFDLAASGRELARQKTKEELAQIDSKAKEERTRIIADFSVNGSMPGRIDHTKSEEGRAFLNKIKITGRDGKFSEPLTLAAVMACRFCDTVQQMTRALDNWINEQNTADEANREARQQRERSGFVGARGGVR